MSNALRLVVMLTVTVVVSSGCPGNSSAPDFGWPGPPPPDLSQPQPLPDFGVPDAPNPCAALDTDGQSCNGGQVCPKGLQPMRLPDGSCTCRTPCVPEQPEQCGGSLCDRVCVARADSSGNPIPGAGVCLPDPGQPQGEPCGPASCKQRLLCIGPGDSKAFCRRTCGGPGECPGHKMVCGEVEGEDTLICVPGENPGGPGEGGDCSAPETYCNLGFICDPEINKCLVTCNTDGQPAACSTGSCTRIVDAQAQVTLGYGCK